jgi:hypothetical protein
MTGGLPNRVPTRSKFQQSLFLRVCAGIGDYFAIAERWRAKPFSHHHAPIEIEREVQPVAGLEIPTAAELDREGDLAFAGQSRLRFQAHGKESSPLIPYRRENSLLFGKPARACYYWLFILNINVLVVYSSLFATRWRNGCHGSDS